MAEHTAETRGIKIALAGSAALFLVQILAYFATNILMLLAGAFDVLSDIFISIFLLLSISWSRKPADEFHMFGHGRSQYVAALLTSTILIFILSAEAFRTAIPQLFQTETEEFHNLDLAVTVALTAIVVYTAPLVDILRVKKKGAAIKAQLTALIEMDIAFAVSLVGIFLVAQGYLWADALASLIIAAVIAISGLFLFKDNVEYLVGKAPSREFMKQVESIVKSTNGVLGVHDLKAEYVGPNIVHTGFHIEIAKGTPIEEADRIAEKVNEKVSQQTGCQYCVIHIDPVGNPPQQG